MHLALGLVCISYTLGIRNTERKDDYMKKFNLVLALVLVLSLALVGCNKAPQTMDETDQSKMQSIPADKADDIKTTDTTEAQSATDAMTVKLSAEDAVKIFTDKYANVNIDEISFELDNGVYAYEINGFDDASEYELEVNAVDGSIIKDKSEKDNTSDKNALDLTLIKNIDELVAASLKDAGDGYHLNSFSLEHEAGITKLEVEVEDASGKDIEYEYNLETKELIKKDL